jgi:hypothetical protein
MHKFQYINVTKGSCAGRETRILMSRIGIGLLAGRFPPRCYHQTHVASEAVA